MPPSETIKVLFDLSHFSSPALTQANRYCNEAKIPTIFSDYEEGGEPDWKSEIEKGTDTALQSMRGSEETDM